MYILGEWSRVVISRKFIYSRSKIDIDTFKKKAQILVAGAGALGCEILKNLAKSGFCRIEIVDFDTIEVSNLNRQLFFSVDDVGKHKSTVAVEKCRQLCDLQDETLNLVP